VGGTFIEERVSGGNWLTGNAADDLGPPLIEKKERKDA